MDTLTWDGQHKSLEGWKGNRATAGREGGWKGGTYYTEKGDTHTRNGGREIKCMRKIDMVLGSKWN